jgi:hypothetical protein
MSLQSLIDKPTELLELINECLKNCFDSIDKPTELLELINECLKNCFDSIDIIKLINKKNFNKY